MALQFTPGIRNIYAHATFNNLTSGGVQTYLLTPQAVNTVAIYSGPQPSTADFVTNYNTTYRPSATNSPLLALFQGVAWTRTDNHFVITTFPGSTAPLKAGVAAWAVLMNTGSPNTASLDNSTYFAGRSFTIVPVSTITGNGVIRFVSLNFDPASAVTLIDGGFSIL